MIHVVLVLLAIFATWRLTYDLTQTEGPGGIYLAIRDWVKSKEGIWPDWITQNIDCYHCCSFWVGFAVAILLPWGSWQQYALHALGISGAVTLIARYIKAMYGADLFD